MGHGKRGRPAAALSSLVGVWLLTSPASAQDCEVKVGVVGPMTGGASAFGLAAKAGGEFQAALANEAGGLPVGDRKCRVRILSFDSQYTAAGGAAASNFLASEGIHVTLGPIGSPETTGFRPVAKRHGQVSFSHSYMNGVITPEFPLGFHGLQSPATWGPILVAEAKAQFKFDTVMIVGANDQGGTDASRQLAKMYADVGAKVSEEYFQRGTTNFAPLATRVINANPDVVDLATVPPGDALIMTKQLMEAGFAGTIGSLGGIGAGPIIQGAGGVDKLKGFYWLELVPVDDPGVVRMKADFERIMKVPPPENATLMIASTEAEQILRAISLAGTDKDADKIAAALRSMTPESRYLGKGGWRGKTIYAINQELAFPIGLGIVKDGRKVGVKRVEIPAE